MRRNPVFAVIGILLLVALGLAASLLMHPEPAPPPTISRPTEGPRVLRFGHNIPVDSALHQAAVRFADDVGKSTQGHLKVEVFPAQQLGTDDQMLEMTRRGELDILLIPTAKVSVAVPAMQYADLPFYFPAREDLYAMLDGEPGQMLLDKLRDIELVGVTFWENGFKHFTGRRPLLEPTDFAGENVRIMKSRMLVEQFRALGAHAIPIDFHATRQALVDGVVDGQENPLIAIVSMGLHQVQPHLTLSSHGYLGYVFVISARTFAGLSPEQQRLLVDSARALTPWEREETHRREQALLEQIRQAGVTVHELSPEQRRHFAAATAHIPALFEDVIGADLLSKTDELLDRKYGPPPGEHILVALDTDLSQECSAAGLAIKRGAQLAIDDINARGGVLGKPLRLIARDNKALPSLGTGNIDYFANRADVVAVLGGTHSAVVVAQNDAIHRHRLPFLVPWAAAAEVVDNGRQPNFTFRVSANDANAAPYLADHMLRESSRPAVLLENTIWGRGALERLNARLQQQGATFARVETYNRGENDFSAQLGRIEQAGADGLLLLAVAHEGGEIIDALARRGKAPHVDSHWGISCGDFWSAHRESLAKLSPHLFQTFSFVDNPRPQAQSLAARYLHEFGLSSPRQILAPQAVAQAHDLVQLLARAITRAGSTDRERVRDALEHLPSHEGAVKTYAPAFTADRHDALGLADYHMARFAEDGAIVPLEHAQ